MKDGDGTEVLLTLKANQIFKVDLEYFCRDPTKSQDLGTLSVQKLIDTLSLDLVY